MTVEAVPSPLRPTTVAAVTELVRAAAESDGVSPLSERTLLHLTGEHPGELHLLSYDGEALVGYGSLGPDCSAELVVATGARRSGIGTELGTALLELGGADLRLWAHGRLPGADQLAERLGLEVTRELYFLRRAASAGPLPEPVWPAGVELRTFVPGQDDAGWLAANARAFADHPEQGSWGPSDLADRTGQPWFDPAGFFLAVDKDSGAIAGYHWTKIHPDTGEGPVGEVYIVGVDPAYQGTGLGKALTVIGLRHLHAERGLDTVVLYVDGANAAARALYEKLGFTPAALDVQFAPRQ